MAWTLHAIEQVASMAWDAGKLISTPVVAA
jgi:hypothetical protein